MPYLRHPAALLLRESGAGELHLCARCRPCVWEIVSKGHYLRRDYLCCQPSPRLRHQIPIKKPVLLCLCSKSKIIGTFFVKNLYILKKKCNFARSYVQSLWRVYAYVSNRRDCEPPIYDCEAVTHKIQKVIIKIKKVWKTEKSCRTATKLIVPFGLRKQIC